MIKRDFFMRMVQELMQALQRVDFLRRRHDYEAALQHIEETLAHFWDLPQELIKDVSLDDWVSLCFAEEGSINEKLVSLADLFKEQGDLNALQQRELESIGSYNLALGLYLETLQNGLVSLDLIQKADALIPMTANAPRPAAVSRRLLAYFETRGRFAQAEDTLFHWLDTGDPQARQEGLAFYERLLAKTDQELEAGELPRAEVEESRQELLARGESK